MTDSTAGTADGQLAPGRTLTRASFLAVSWTWCIGMFLPLLLLRDYGIWSFLIFAIPNCVGAAAMGWVLRSSDDAHAVIRNHLPLVRLFSWVTQSFQLFFLASLAMTFADDRHALIVLFCGVALGLVNGIGQSRLLGSLFLLVISAVAVAISAREGRWSADSIVYQGAAMSAWHLIPLGMVCAIGFGLCPYLDATFLETRAVSPTPRGSRSAFGLGFLVLFPLMIIGTLVYAPLFGTKASLGNLPTHAAADVAVRASVLYVIAHLAWQLTYTSIVHAGSLRRMICEASRRGDTHEWNGDFFGKLAAVAIPAMGVFLALIARNQEGVPDEHAFEQVYRGFMGFYGLVFPAYVAVNWPLTAPRPPRIGMWLAAMTLAAPFYWWGFMQRDTWWLAPGVAIVVACAIVGRAGLNNGAERSLSRSA